MKFKCRMRVVVTLTFIVISTHFAEVSGAPYEGDSLNHRVDLEIDTKLEADPSIDKPLHRPIRSTGFSDLKCADLIGRYVDGKWEGLEPTYDLKSVLAKYGGLPGEVNATRTEKSAAPVENATDERPLPVADPEHWLYSFTGTDYWLWARGEHAVRRFSGTPKEFLEIRGVILWAPEDFCGQMRRASYIVDDRGFTFNVSRGYCVLTRNDRYQCVSPPGCNSSNGTTSVKDGANSRNLPGSGQLDALASFQKTPEVKGDSETCLPPPTVLPTSIPAQVKCSKLIGRYKDGKWAGLEATYDLKSVLAKHGGLPGEVNATWTNRGAAPVENATDERPLPVADPEYWIYSIMRTDSRTWARGEHAVRRFSGTPKEFLEIRGAVLWSPDDFCGEMRYASYIVDDRGFTFNVSRGHCRKSFHRYSWGYECAFPLDCHYSDDKVTECNTSRPSKKGPLADLRTGAPLEEIPDLKMQHQAPSRTPEDLKCDELEKQSVGLETLYDLKSVLAKNGGPPGEVNATWTEKNSAPVENSTDERPLPSAGRDYWLYSFTGTDYWSWARGEHAVRRFSGTPKEFVEIRGVIVWAPADFCGKMRRASYIVDDRGFTFNVSGGSCSLSNDLSYTCLTANDCPTSDGSTSVGDFNFCGFPSYKTETFEEMPEKEPFTFPVFQPSTPKQEKCFEMDGTYQDGQWLVLEPSYDLKSVLAKNGGLPGKVNVTWTEKNGPPVENATDERPLPIADPEYWLYSYIDTDYSSSYRGEHAVRRFSGTPKEFVEIRGAILWTPEDYCGQIRRASYVVDDRGFTFNVSRGHCVLSGDGKYECNTLTNCTSYDETHSICDSWSAIYGLTTTLNRGERLDEIPGNEPSIPTAPPIILTPEQQKCEDLGVRFRDGQWVVLEATYDVKSVLAKYGGLPGEVNATRTEKSAAPVENATDERPLPIADPEYWLYNFTDTDGKTWVRGEHAVHRFSGTPKEFLEIRGVIVWAPDDFCGQMRRASYIVDDRGFTFNVSRGSCTLYVGGRYQCEFLSNCSSSDENHVTCGDLSSKRGSSTALSKGETIEEMPAFEPSVASNFPPPIPVNCKEMDSQSNELETTYDLQSVLAKNGGPPGKVNAKWTEKIGPPVENATDERPLPIADPEYWLYSYTGTDGETYARGEHAVRRFSGTPKEFLEVRGAIIWDPDEFGRNMRLAYYTIDDRGFTFELQRDKCWLHYILGQYFCTSPPPPQCGTPTFPASGGTLNPNLLASLLGG